MVLRERRKQRVAADAAEAPPQTPKQSKRPSKRAQWDEMRAAWVEWDVQTNDWVVVASEPDPEEQLD